MDICGVVLNLEKIINKTSNQKLKSNKLRYLLRSVIVLIMLSLFLGIYVWRIEPRWVEWNHLDMPTANLPASLMDKKIVQISDIHIGEMVEEDFIIKQFNEVNKINPDIVVYTGDFISPNDMNQASIDQLEKHWRMLRKANWLLLRF